MKLKDRKRPSDKIMFFFFIAILITGILALISIIWTIYEARKPFSLLCITILIFIATFKFYNKIDNKLNE